MVSSPSVLHVILHNLYFYHCALYQNLKPRSKKISEISAYMYLFSYLLSVLWHTLCLSPAIYVKTSIIYIYPFQAQEKLLLKKQYCSRVFTWMITKLDLIHRLSSLNLYLDMNQYQTNIFYSGNKYLFTVRPWKPWMPKICLECLLCYCQWDSRPSRWKVVIC